MTTKKGRTKYYMIQLSPSNTEKKRHHYSLKIGNTKQVIETYLKFIRWGEATSRLDLTKKTPSGGNVITLFNTLFCTSITCKTSPVSVPKNPAFLMIKSCSFSVVHNSRHVPDKDSLVVTAPRPCTAISSMVSMIWESILGSFWVVRPLFWLEMRERRVVLEVESEEWRWVVSLVMWGLGVREVKGLKMEGKVGDVVAMEIDQCGWWLVMEVENQWSSA